MIDLVSYIYHTYGLGNPDVLAYTMAGIRIVTGLFFGISGAHKTFSASRRRDLRGTLKDLHIPFHRINTWVVAVTELVAGTMLALGLFTVPCAIVLFVLCFVATVTEGVKATLAYPWMDWLDCFDTFLYQPEVLYCIMLLATAAYGPSLIGMDDGNLAILIRSSIFNHLGG